MKQGWSNQGMGASGPSSSTEDGPRRWLSMAVDAAYVAGADGLLAGGTGPLADLLGCGPEELAGLAVSQFSPPGESVPCVGTLHRIAMESGFAGPAEVTLRRKDGASALALVRVRRVIEESGRMWLVGGMEDRREVAALRAEVESLRAEPGGERKTNGHKQDAVTQERLDRASTLLEQLVNSVQTPVFYKDSQSVYLGCNAAFEALTGRASHEIVGRTDVALFPAELALALMEQDQRLFRTREPQRDEVWVRYPDGSEVLLEILRHLYCRPDGTVVGLIAISQDVTERRRAAERLQESERRFRLLAENVSDVITRHAPDGTYLYVSPSCLKHFGYTQEELVGKRAQDFIHPDDVHLFDLGQMENVVNGDTFKIEYRRRLKHGGYCWVETRLKTLRNPKTGEVQDVFSVVRDISERKQSEEALLTATRMEATAMLAGGIAHDFNNLMAVVLGNVALLQEEVGWKAPAVNMIREIERAAQRAGELTQHMLAFARGGKYQPQVLLINPLIEDTLRLHAHMIPSHIRVVQTYDLEARAVVADAAQMGLVILNLCRNAVEAIEGEGEIAIETRRCEVTPDAPVDGLIPGPHVRIDIRDTGCGMSEATAARIFEPFFSTKFQGRGMGLAAVYGVVKNHGGYIGVETAEGRGATFSVYMPEVEALPEPVEKNVAEPARGTETILLVDDEEVLLDVIQLVLSMMGYKVLTARNGEEALDVVRHYDGRIDLCVLDMVMPVMGGAEVYPLLKEACPEMKVLLISGYELDAAAKQVIDQGANGFLQKPLTRMALATQIRAVLDKVN